MIHFSFNILLFHQHFIKFFLEISKYIFFFYIFFYSVGNRILDKHIICTTISERLIILPFHYNFSIFFIFSEKTKYFNKFDRISDFLHFHWTFHQIFRCHIKIFFFYILLRTIFTIKLRLLRLVSDIFVIISYFVKIFIVSAKCLTFFTHSL